MKQLSKRVVPILPEEKKNAAKDLRLAVGGAIEGRSKDYQFHFSGLRENTESMAAFVMHLYQFRSKELWRESGHKSFKAFCENEVIPLMKIPLALSRLYQLADYQEVKESLPKKLSTIVETEGQARALKAAEPEVRAEILKEVASEGEVTAKAITEKIEERRKEKPKEAKFEEIKKDDVVEIVAELTDEITGEVLTCSNCIRLVELLKEKERNHRGLVFKYNELVRDKEKDMKEDELYSLCLGVFDYWKITTKHKRSHFTLDTYNLVRPFVKKYGVERCKDSIDGAAFDCFIDERKNGSQRKHNDLDLIMRDRKHFEEFCNRSPKYGKKK